MKKLFSILSLLAATSAGAGGIAVTNGKTFYSMSGFTVQYETALTLNVASPTAFDISNTKLVKASEPISKVAFQVAHAPGKKLSDVFDDLKNKFPTKDIQAIQQPGAAGYYWEEKSTTVLTGHYDLLTSNDDLVDITLQAYSVGDGLVWVAPIVHSLVYDSTPPVVLEMRVENRVWPAGSRQTIHLHITDDYSGVKPDVFFSYEAPNHNEAPPNEKAYYVLSAKLVPEGNDWYSCTVEVSPYLPSRIFRLSSVTVSDIAGNRRRLEADLKDTNYTANPSMPGKLVPTVRMKVVNHGTPDFTAPQLVGFRPDATVWEVGSTHRVYFKITDDGSGVDLTNPEVGISQPCSIGKVNSNQSTSGRACNGESPGMFVHYRSEGSDWYSAEYTVRDYMPSGRYRIGAIAVNDKAGNLRMYSLGSRPSAKPSREGLAPVFEFTLHNAGHEDVAPPEFLEWKVDSSTWKAGETAKIYLRIKDNISGVSLQDMGVIFKRTDGALTASVENSGQPVAEGNDWYSLLVPVDQFLKAGTYYPSFVMMQDNASNETLVDCQPNGSCQVRSGGALNLPPLNIELIR